MRTAGCDQCDNVEMCHWQPDCNFKFKRSRNWLQSLQTALSQKRAGGVAEMFQTESKNVESASFHFCFHSPFCFSLSLLSLPSLSDYNTHDCSAVREWLWLRGNQRLENGKLPSLHFPSLQPFALSFFFFLNAVSSSLLGVALILSLLHFQSEFHSNRQQRFFFWIRL